MLHRELLEDEGILILRPDGPLESTDFESVAEQVDPFIERSGDLRGILIDARTFPGWKDFGALISHVRFIRDHHRHVRRIAAVSDSGFLTIAPRIGTHFVSAEVRHFAADEREAAMDWLRG